jgi:3-oxoacyl-[acyl-carrier protein] reductase
MSVEQPRTEHAPEDLLHNSAALQWALVPDLRGQVALVTGGSRGIGREISHALGAVGAQVVIAARKEAEIAVVVDEIAAAGGRAAALPADLTKEADVAALFSRLQDRFGRLDVLVNDAAISPQAGPMVDVSTEDLDAVLALNLRGAFLCCREAVKIMMVQRSGYIINISSASGVRGYVNQAAYCASKHGLMGLTKVLAMEGQEYGIRVSVILPGAVDTPMISAGRPDLAMQSSVLLQPDDIARSVLFLLALPKRAAVDQIYLRRSASQPFPV